VSIFRALLTYGITVHDSYKGLTGQIQPTPKIGVANLKR